MLLDQLVNNGMLPMEIEEGNIEYKLQINSDISIDQTAKIRATRLLSQLNWRLNEGKILYSKSIAAYIIGITNTGDIGKQSELQVDESIKNLDIIVTKCNAKIVSIIKKIFEDKYCVAEVIIQKYDDIFINELRVCMIGESNSGKTTLISHLCSFHMDDGNGSGRNTIMRHVHEQFSVITSCIKHELIGYSNNKIINYKSCQLGSWEKIVYSSDFVVTLIDLPGQNKYMKTTIYGLLSRKPHLCFLTISLDGNNVISNQLIQQLEMLYYCKMKFIIIFTKSDCVQTDDLLNTLKNIIQLNISFVEYHNDFNILHDTNSYQTIIPYIITSNVLGKGFTNIHHLFNNCYQNNYYNIQNKDILSTNKVYFIIGDNYIGCNEFISDQKTFIASGLLVSGIINVDDILKLGPYNNTYLDVRVKNIHKKQIDFSSFYANEYGSIELELVESIDKIITLNNHMILTNYDIIYVDQCYMIIYNDISNVVLDKLYNVYFDNRIEPCIITHILNNTITLRFNNKVCLFKQNCIAVIKCENYIYGHFVS